MQTKGFSFLAGCKPFAPTQMWITAHAFKVASRVGTTFFAMCCTKLLKTSSVASMIPNPTAYTCGTPSVSKKMYPT